MMNHSTVLNLAFKQTKAEEMVRAASTILFNAISELGYPSVSLSKLALTPQYGFTATACSEEVGPKLVRITDIQDGIINWETVPYCQCNNPEKYLLAPGDILFARTGATTGKTYLVKQIPYAIFASYLIRLHPNVSVCAEYLYSFFQSNAYWSLILDEREGSAQPNVNGKKLLNLEVPLVDSETQILISKFLEAVRLRQDGADIPFPELPAFLSHSRQLVGRIERVAARIEEARELRRQAVEETNALIFSAKGALFSEGSNKEWPVLKLGDVAEIKAGVTLGRSLGSSTIKLPYLRVANVQDGYLDLNLIKEIEILESEREKWRLQDGDILLTEGGDWDKLGRGAVWHNEIPNCIHQNHIFRLRIDLKKFDPEYLCALIGSAHGKTYFQTASKQTTNLASINQRQLKAFKIFKPPLREQHRIVSYLGGLQSKLDTLKRLQAETAAELNALMPAVLERAFSGEL